MMYLKLNSNNRLVEARTIAAVLAAAVFVCLSSAAGFCAEVPMDTARQVAMGVLQHHEDRFGHWNGSQAPTLGDGTVVRFEGEAVAFNFQVRPSGHVLVVVDDDLSPVPLYSTTSTFDPGRSGNPNAIEAWMVPELKGRVRFAREVMARSADSALATTQSEARRRVHRAWSYFEGLGGDAALLGSSRGLSATSGDMERGAAVEPLLTTVWDQDAPYYLKTPAGDGCDHTLTGCVATAWAQVLNYWKWPARGQSSHSYDWEGPGGTENLSVDFSAATYDWALMPDDLTAGSTAEQKAAVSEFIYHLAVAVETDFGCGVSSSSFWADEVLDTYFKYKTLTVQNRLRRESYDAAQWFGLFKAELDADPPRPVIFTIGSDLGWHEVVVDGYQEGAANLVHVNFGWQGSYDGYYNINDDSDFNAGSFDWYVNSNQLIVVGIEPDNPVPTVDAGSDQSAEEEAEVQLSGSATDPAPDSTAISSYLWSQLSGPAVVIHNATSTTATFTAPNVHSETQLVFQLRAEDGNRAHGTDSVTVTVGNTDGSVAPAAPASSGGGSSGCFAATAIH
jgi:hypothetical protein